MLGQCWADVVDGGPTFTQHWFNVSCFLGAWGAISRTAGDRVSNVNLGQTGDPSLTYGIKIYS